MPELHEQPVLLETRNLSRVFRGKRSLFRFHVPSVHAVNNVSLRLREHEVLGLVGESGCGKSTLGRTILRLIEPSGGEIFFKGQNILNCNPEEMRQLRQKMQIIFQDVYSSLNPRMTVEEIVRAPLDVFHLGTPAEKKAKVLQILEEVGLGEQQLHRFPHEFSGGQRQRIGFARALIVQPELVICDEPVSALDVSVRAQVLNLMKRLQIEKGLSYLFISHDLSVVKHISNRIAVMYLGNIVELSESEELYQNPLHPYTQALLSAIPIPDPENKRQRILLEGDLPSPYAIPQGCPFHTRCPYAQERCLKEKPELKALSSNSQHSLACFLHA